LLTGDDSVVDRYTEAWNELAAKAAYWSQFGMALLAERAKSTRSIRPDE
jgi:hypothetical protein